MLREYRSKQCSFSHTGSALLLVSLSVTLLAGCGSSNKTVATNSSSTPTPTATPTPTPSGLPTATPTPVATPTPLAGFAGRSFTASNLSLGTGTTGSLTVAVGSQGSSVAASLNLVLSNATRASRQTTTSSNVIIPLSGSVNASTGAFTVSGTVSQDGITYAVTATGTFSASATSGGMATITLNGTNYAITFAASQALTGTLDASYFPLIPNTNLAYTITTFQVESGSMSSPEAGGPEAGYSFLGAIVDSPSGYYGERGFLERGETLGTPTQTTFNGASVNSIADMVNGNVVGHFYYTEDTSKLSLYGTDTGIASPALVVPVNLAAGQTYTQSVSETFGTDTSLDKSLKFSFTFNGFQTVTVPTGTYTAAMVTETYTINSANANTFGGVDVGTLVYYLVPNIGVVRLHHDNKSYNTVGAEQLELVADYVLSSTSGVNAETRSVRPASASSGRGILGITHGRRP